MNQLQTITGNFRITFNSSLSTLSIHQLTQVSGEFRVNNIGSGLTSLSLPLLDSSGNIWIADAAGITNIEAPEFTTGNGIVSIGSCSALTTVAFPKLASVSSNLDIDNCFTFRFNNDHCAYKCWW